MKIGCEEVCSEDDDGGGVGKRGLIRNVEEG